MTHSFEFMCSQKIKGNASVPYAQTSNLLLSVKPRIDRTNLKPIVIKAGKMVKYDVNIRGEPPPTVKWFHADSEVRS